MHANPANFLGFTNWCGIVRLRCLLATLMETFSALQSLGLELPTPAYIFGAIVFGIVGMVAYWRGKRTENRRTRWIGLALMFYPYAVSQTWLLFALGAALSAGVWWEWS